MSSQYSAHQRGSKIECEVVMYQDHGTPGCIVRLDIDGDYIGLHLDSVEEAAELALVIAHGAAAAARDKLAARKQRQPILEEVPLVF